VTARADLFALGVVLYECLTTQLPFSGTSTFDYVRHVMQSAPRRLDRIVPDTPAELVDLIEQCLEKSPAARPESAGAVVATLRRLSNALTSPDAAVHTARQARAGRRWRVVAALALAALAVAGGWSYWGPGGTAEDTPRVTHAFVTSGAQEFGSRISPDGQWVAFMATAGGATQVLLQQIDGGEARPLTLERGTPRSVAWSPDGRQIACVLEVDGQILVQIYPAFFGGTSQQTLPLAKQLSTARLLRWIGRSLYVELSDPKADQALSLQRIDLDAGVLANASAGWKVDGRLDSIDLHPDGRTVAFVTMRNGQEDLFTANVDGSGMKALTADAFVEREPVWSGRGDRIIVRSNRGGQLDLWEIETQTGHWTSLTAGEMDEIPESTSTDGSVISFRRVSREAKLWRWDAGGQTQQLTEDALSDYSPSISVTGGLIAFQRAQAIPARGFAIIDTRLLVAPYDGRAIGAPRVVGDGFLPGLSPDGLFLAYLKLAHHSGRATLELRDMTSGVTSVVSEDTLLPIFSGSPVGWADSVMAWSATGAELYFIHADAPSEIRRIRVREPANAETLYRADAGEYLRDLHVSPDGGSLAFLTVVPSAKADVVVSSLDLGTRARRTTKIGPSSFTGVYGRGWVDTAFVVVRRTELHEDSSGTVEVVLVDKAGARTAGVIPTSFITTAKLHPVRRVLYITRLEKGAQNLYELSLATGKLLGLTKNTLPGVSYSGLSPAGSNAFVGVREERREDIWLIRQDDRSRRGNPAGR
jgi:hypothetical protein